MPQDHPCTECVERRWDESRMWFRKLARALHVKEWHLLLPPFLAMLVVELTSKRGLVWHLYLLALAPLVAMDLAWFLSFVRRHVIGTYLYMFRDADGNRHLHRKSPEARFWFSPPEYFYQDRKIRGEVLRLKLGGLLRSNEVLNSETKRWYGCGGSWGKVKIADYSGGPFHEGSLGGEVEAEPERILDIVNNYSSVLATFDAHERKSATIEVMRAKLSTLVDEIHQDRNRLGRSKHAQYARESIEDALRLTDSMLAGQLSQDNFLALVESSKAASPTVVAEA